MGGNMSSVFERLPKDWCPYCNEHSICLVTTDKHIIDYPKLVANKDEARMLSIMNDMEFDHMICRRCARYFPINWTDNWPEPMDINFVPFRFFLM